MSSCSLNSTYPSPLSHSPSILFIETSQFFCELVVALVLGSQDNNVVFYSQWSHLHSGFIVSPLGICFGQKNLSKKINWMDWSLGFFLLAFVITEVYTRSVLCSLLHWSGHHNKKIKVFPSQKIWFHNDVKELFNIRDAAYWAKETCILQKIQSQTRYKDFIQQTHTEDYGDSNAMTPRIYRKTYTNLHIIKPNPSLAKDLKVYFTSFDRSNNMSPTWTIIGD